MAEVSEDGSEAARNTFLQVAGLKFPESPFWTSESVERFFSLKPQPDDIIISSYPKCDSNYVDAIVWKLIFPRQKLQDRDNLTNRNIPCIEMTLADDYLKRMQEQFMKYKSPRILKTYLPLKLIPIYKRPKYIYVIRTPWEACASYYRYLCLIESTKDSFESFVEKFISGEVAYESFVTHVTAWLKMSTSDNVLILCHEHVQHNPRSAMYSIAAFLGDKYLQQLVNHPEYGNSIVKSLKWDEPSPVKPSVKDSDIFMEVANSVLKNEEEPKMEMMAKPVCNEEQIKNLTIRIFEQFKETSVEPLWMSLLKKYEKRNPRQFM